LTFCFNTPLGKIETLLSSFSAPFRAGTTIVPLDDMSKLWPRIKEDSGGETRAFFDGGGVNPPSLSLPGESSLHF
jgi:hypothetical protein